MVLKVVGKFVLILVPLTVSCARLHSHAARTPVDVTRELNRCLSVVRVAAARRGADSQSFVRTSRRPSVEEGPI